MRPRIPLSLLIATTISTSPHSALAAWPHSPGTNLGVCTIAREQFFPQITSDGAGGAIVTWYDFRNANFDIYAEHVTPTGALDPAWPAGGRAICTAAGAQQNSRIVADGSGGAIVAWEDSRSGTSDIYAQHVLANGTVDGAWPVDGRVLCAAAGNQTQIAILGDGSGGAIVAWMDRRSGTNNDIYAQHVQANGVVDPLWPVDGRALCTAANDQTVPTIATDGSTGAIVTWQDARAGLGNIYAQHVLLNGTVDFLWPADGRGMCTTANNQELPTIIGDGSGGAFVTWDEQRGTRNIYAQHVLANGALDAAWPADGNAVCSAANSQFAPVIVSDNAGGGIVAWRDQRSGGYDIYAQHVTVTGADPAWPVDGVALCTAAGDQYLPVIATDGAGGAIVAWPDLRSGAYDIYAQHIQSSGLVDPTWPTDGRALCTAAADQFGAVIVADGAGGAIVAWQDGRTGSAPDIYAQRVARFGYLGTPEPVITGVRDIPNDQGGKVKVSWDGSWLDYEINPWIVSYYKIYRSVAPNASGSAQQNVDHSASAVDKRERAFLDQLERATGFSWEYIAYIYAEHVSFITSYSYIAATLSDSTGAYNPTTAFLVAAFDQYGSMYWASTPASGYSVDNLPPAPPQPFSGEYGAGVAHLHWGPNAEADFGNYRLYRGTTSGFVPSSANRIASPPDTGYVDHAGATYYYKLSAVDIHGNESGYTALLPGGALDVPGDALPREIALERPRPNPALGPAALRFTLPRDALVSLVIYDAAGRKIRELVSGWSSAGEHPLMWDLRDDAGRAVGAGLYFARLNVEGRSISQRFATLR